MARNIVLLWRNVSGLGGADENRVRLQGVVVLEDRNTTRKACFPVDEALRSERRTVALSCYSSLLRGKDFS